MDSKANQNRVLTLTKMLYAIIKSGQSSLSRIGAEMPGATEAESWVKQALPICWLVRKGKKGHMSVNLHVEVPDTLLIVVCIAFLLVFALATFQNKLQKHIPKFLRKDRISAYSFFSSRSDFAPFGFSLDST
ncbi:hypothetical protein [Tunicatimonas pelagia]|uniref:hypothetical protein n=1 Tax=Tunicatimonas pelagia TaxID=931531 RepID=UPI0026654E13|nr:hypothetical protein [Tunicatimonas pelagia]WKN42021.1 hypothetical protein P0M28_23545 [Tunicatimonas pelagia]